MAEHQNVPNEHVNEELEKKKSLKYFHGESGAEAVGEASNAYAPASLIAAGAGSSTVAMMSMLNNFVAAFLYTKVPTVIQRMGSRKRLFCCWPFWMLSDGCHSSRYCCSSNPSIRSG